MRVGLGLRLSSVVLVWEGKHQAPEVRGRVRWLWGRGEGWVRVREEGSEVLGLG